MDKLKVCFVGFGSIAKRHIKNLFELCDQKSIMLTIDLFRSGAGMSGIGEEYEQYINDTYFDIGDMPSDYDIVFVTNPTSCHTKSIVAFMDKTVHFFIEKPVFSSSSDLQLIEKMRSDSKKNEECGNRIFYVACPMRYTKVIEYIKENVDFDTIHSVRSICSSYLPEWRKNTDYRESYSAHKALGGGVSIDLIHEWDYLTYFIGMPDVVYSSIGKYSNLEIDSDDLAIYIAKYKDKCVELHLDYFGRYDIRKVELYGDTETIVGDLIHNTVCFQKSGQLVSFSEERDDYQKKELETFLMMLDGTLENTNTVENACRVLDIAKGEF